MPTLVSIIVPNFNHLPFLKRRLDSIYVQTFRDFEIILLDDNSSDSSWDFIQEQHQLDNRITHIQRNLTNSGSPYLQWEQGIELAKGEWIWIAESDDWAEPEFLETLLSATTERTSIAFCHSSIEFENTHFNDLEKKGVFRSFDGSSFIKSKMTTYPTILNASMAVFRRNNFKAEFLKSNPPLCYSQDWMFWIHMCQQGDVIEFTGKLNHFRQHANKVSPGADSLGMNFIDGSIIWHFLRDQCKIRLSLFDKFHIAIRWTLSRSRFKQSVESKTIEAMSTYHSDITRMYLLLRPFSNLIQRLYALFH